MLFPPWKYSPSRFADLDMKARGAGLAWSSAVAMCALSEATSPVIAMPVAGALAYLSYNHFLWSIIKKKEPEPYQVYLGVRLRRWNRSYEDRASEHGDEARYSLMWRLFVWSVAMLGLRLSVIYFAAFKAALLSRT